MSGSIRLHPKYGVNPTVPRCFWCGKDRNEVALLGAAYKGEAPRSLVIDYEPCDKCKATMGQGITLVEAERVGNEPRFTGRWMVVSEDFVHHHLQPESMVKAVLEHRRAFIEPEAFARLLPQDGKPS